MVAVSQDQWATARDALTVMLVKVAIGAVIGATGAAVADAMAVPSFECGVTSAMLAGTYGGLVWTAAGLVLAPALMRWMTTTFSHAYETVSAVTLVATALSAATVGALPAGCSLASGLIAVCIGGCSIVAGVLALGAACAAVAGVAKIVWIVVRWTGITLWTYCADVGGWCAGVGVAGTKVAIESAEPNPRTLPRGDPSVLV